jgi:hypothetical protein
MKIKSVLCIVAMGVLGLAACKSDSTSTSNNNNNNSSGGTVPSTPNTIAYTSDGTAYSATGTGTKQTFGGQTIITVAGFDLNNRTLGFSVTNIASTGTFDVGKFIGGGAGAQVISMQYGFVGSAGDTVVYTTSQSGTSSAGKMTITESSATAFKGTFDVTLSKASAGSGASTVHLVGGANITLM